MEIGIARLIWIHQNFVSRNQAGNSRPVLLLSALLERGWSIDLICGHGSYLDSDIEPSRYLTETEGNLRIHRLGMTRGKYGHHRRKASYVDFSRKALGLALRLEHPDLIYCSSPPLPQVLPALFLAAYRHLPLVFEVRDLWPAMLVEIGMVKSSILDGLLSVLEASVARFADRCLMVSPGFTRYFEALGVPKCKIEVIPTGSDSALADCPPELARSWRSANDLDGNIVVLYAGSLNEYYGIEDVLRAADRAHGRDPRIVWVFCGDGRERPRVTAAARKKSYVRDLGPIPKTALAPLLKGADIALVTLSDYPLFRSVLPGKLFDYMAAGLPVLSCASGHSEEILTRSGAGWSCEAQASLGDTPTRFLAGAAVEMAALSHEERRAMGEAGQKWAAAWMNAHQLARDWAVGLDQTFIDSQTSERRPKPGLRRLLRSLLGGVADVALGRSRGAREAISRPEAQLQSADSLGEWLDSRSEAPVAYLLDVPLILSESSVDASDHRSM
ncbi:MAG: glycosyltransferase family 4 protein [Myxococcota bacterium]|nr:glycosyltransferase family 4 protein [Myxococcota bacterium]